MTYREFRKRVKNLAIAYKEDKYIQILENRNNNINVVYLTYNLSSISKMNWLEMYFTPLERLRDEFVYKLHKLAVELARTPLEDRV